MGTTDEEKPVSVRMPAALKKALKEVADKEKRSMNQTFLYLIERGIAAYKRDGKFFEPEQIHVEAKPSTISVPTMELGKKTEDKKKRA